MDEQEAEPESSQEELESESSESKSAAEESDSNSGEDERDSQEGRSGDGLAWLEGPAFNSPIEEMPTMQWQDVEAETDAEYGNLGMPEPTDSDEDVKSTDGGPDQTPDELEDAIQWLEELANEQGTPIDDMPTLVSGGESEQDLTANAAAVDVVEQMGDSPPPPILDSDPMAWLEQLAIDQESPLEELPSVADRLLASEIVSQYDADTDGELPQASLSSWQSELDVALQYLEEQAVEQGISLEAVSFDQSEPVESLDNDLNALDQMAAAAVAVETLKNEDDPPIVENEEVEWDDLSAQIPEDPDDALLWLGELAEEESSPESDSDRSALARGAAGVAAAKLVHSGEKKADEGEVDSGQISDEQAMDMVVLEEMPDDPDEAMAWMEGLAGQDEDAQGDQMVSGMADEGEPPSANIPGDAVLAQNKHFDVARAALIAGNVAAAAEQYRNLLDEGQGGPALIDELETAVAEQPEEPDLVQLLGDAYMQDGQLQKAMKSYGKGFDHL